MTSAEPDEMSAEEKDSDVETEKNGALEDSTEANVTNEAESDLNVEAKGLTDRTNAEAWERKTEDSTMKIKKLNFLGGIILAICTMVCLRMGIGYNKSYGGRMSVHTHHSLF